MKIEAIEFENFRNFKGRNRITFDINKPVTIIYGKNGDGKTTLHQLFQWIFYNKVNFNRTATEKMYNHEFESEMDYEQVFEVKGSIDFIDNNERYSVNRTWTYQKGILESKKIKEEVSIFKMNNDNWDKLHDYEAIIEELLPSGLADYFFFDGESMIADLKVKGKESANKLKEALYTIFDLNIFEQALNHIGSNELKTTIMGQLYLSKGDSNTDEQVVVTRTNINNIQNKISEYEEKKKTLANQEKLLNKSIQHISETIGKAKSSEEYEKERNLLKKQREIFLENEGNAYKQFGDEVSIMYPKILISRRIEDAKRLIKLKADSNVLLQGVNRKLIEVLLNEKNCICGNELKDEEKNNLIKYLGLLPPLSYQQTYDNFTKEARKWGVNYNRDLIEKPIKDVLSNRQQADNCDKKIREIDKEAKEQKDIQQLVIDRKKAEEEVEIIKNDLISIETELAKFVIYRKQQMKKYDELTEKTDLNKKNAHMISIMNKVKNYFENELHDNAKYYSEKLQSEIQELLNSMLTSKRKVTVSNDFFVRVIDSYDDESKSEGQFAVVTFAYIGGIFNLLKEVMNDSPKEYPLVLDGPFSKLDEDQKRNVIIAIPQYAPQIILFSKDNLEGLFAEENIGKTWTILSNDEKNVAEIKEGFLW
ncbi:MAG: hypothetical protein BGO41_00935 [Clostridiales bacterium 38-18]|nr:MAG: hypothetical protein BGO41_00935 [Clostridiales bacterium 38-18]